MRFQEAKLIHKHYILALILEEKDTFYHIKYISVRHAIFGIRMRKRISSCKKNEHTICAFSYTLSRRLRFVKGAQATEDFSLLEY